MFQPVMKSMNDKKSADNPESQLAEIRIQVPEDLARAWQRCSWVLVEETGKSRLQSMEEMVRDFLVKHGC